MTVDLRSPRPDLVFMRRRLKAGETLPTASVAASAPVSHSLRLSAPDAPVKPAYKVPGVNGRIVLDEDNPVVRLNVRQSALGSLIGENVRVFGWETPDRVAGIEFAPADEIDQAEVAPMGAMFNDWTEHDRQIRGINPATAVKNTVPSYGNRKLVDYYKGEFVYGLRYFKKLRRVAVGTRSGVITLKLLDGSSIVIDSDEGQNVVYISPIGNQLELRWERLTGTIGSTFSIPSLVP